MPVMPAGSHPAVFISRSGTSSEPCVILAGQFRAAPLKRGPGRQAIALKGVCIHAAAGCDVSGALRGEPRCPQNPGGPFSCETSMLAPALLPRLFSYLNGEAALQRFAALYQGTWHLDPETAGLRIVMLSGGAAQLYVPITFAIGAAGQPAQQTKFLMNQVLVKTPVGWRVSSILPFRRQRRRMVKSSVGTCWDQTHGHKCVRTACWHHSGDDRQREICVVCQHPSVHF
jgi:hypothetical protein